MGGGGGKGFWEKSEKNSAVFPAREGLNLRNRRLQGGGLTSAAAEVFAGLPPFNAAV